MSSLLPWVTKIARVLCKKVAEQFKFLPKSPQNPNNWVSFPDFPLFLAGFCPPTWGSGWMAVFWGN
jgi:hypothetical protein